MRFGYSVIYQLIPKLSKACAFEAVVRSPWSISVVMFICTLLIFSMKFLFLNDKASNKGVAGDSWSWSKCVESSIFLFLPHSPKRKMLDCRLVRSKSKIRTTSVTESSRLNVVQIHLVQTSLSCLPLHCQFTIFQFDRSELSVNSN